MVSAGCINFIGAAYLSSSGALRAGAGLVTLAVASSLQPAIAAQLPEVTYLPLPESSPGTVAPEAAGLVHDECAGYRVLLLGCGLGRTDSARQYVDSLLSQPGLPPLILDADGLNLLAQIPGWQSKIPAGAVLTPHPGEMSRLTGLSIAEIQQDRTGTARRYAWELNCIIVLKGAFTVIAAPDGRCRISPFANPGLASAGTGDVLSGVIAGLAGQGLELYDAASLGVFLHGEAGEKVKAQLGDAGMLASDLLPALPVVIKNLKTKS